ncbi:NADPH-dependent FMN reductase [Capnocytophaga felis]|uniref:FMN reductase n=1 Tax=Capnocytophaga felis TaxID=2267611 RepID=A0A5M4B972_9FLAO|nr:NAD(P)H-dependent oxidoreductase [Capnocytophaga felis]GET46163.1 FMN reductase [Capnocytophaga felis]GET48954.1 FMN reductase [Capnocytophaga felis]
MKVIAFGASTSKTSINQKLAEFAAKQISNDVEVINLRDYEMPLFSVDKEKEEGIPAKASDLLNKWQSAEVIVISFAEHNGAYTAAFKNTFDWVTRLEQKCFSGKKLFLLATSPGARGGKSVLEIALARMPFHGGEIIANFSLPNFEENFSEENGITNPEFENIFEQEIKKAKQYI